MSSHSTYAVPVDKGDSSKESGQVEQLATIHEYIQEFDHNGTVPSKMLFSSYVSCHLSSLFGMKEFGGGEHYHQGIQNWKYYCWHFIMACMFAPGMYVTLHCCGLRIWVSAAIAACTFPPMMFVTMLAESKIFRSRFLAAALLRGGDNVKALNKTGGGAAAAFVGLFVVQFILLYILPFIFLVRPYTQLVPSDIYVEYIMLSVLALMVATLPFSYSFSMWHPLVVLHSKETLLAVEKTTQALEILLFHPQASLTPAEARRELSAITNKLINPLEYELKIMSQETLGTTVVCIPGMIGALYMLCSTFDNNKMGGVGIGFRITIAATMLTSFLFMASSLGNAPKVHGMWRTLSRKLNDAENVSRAAAVFDGDFNAFLEWFRRNEISAKLMGTAIDDELPGKILALFASIMGAVGLVIARISGWY
jgi:hypothetical protein